MQFLAKLVEVAIIRLCLDRAHELCAQAFQFLVLVLSYSLDLLIEFLNLVFKVILIDEILEATKLVFASSCCGLDFEFISFIIDGLDYFLERSQVDFLIKHCHQAIEIVQIYLFANVFGMVGLIDFSVQCLRHR